ncbi:MAG: retron St85 family RNA-directed DNA polymerase [Clostridia bacterium]|nr:retron St85 family RNA-directed DNA polymerase [Clostridia bacterium]MBO5913511.1 retron St85 family RNA-directed DNA polymerase [Clostridia bacterium]
MTLIEKISLDLNLDKLYLARIISRSGFYYKDFIIPKKNGGFRRISQPSAELKTLQYWITKNILCKIPISKAACAYKKGDSIKKHALLHCKSRHILHTDIKDFFESVDSSKLIKILEKNHSVFEDINLDYNSSIDDIRKICFRKNKLCIGSVSSPIISNIVMYDFDNALTGYCKENGLIYSRYADDIYVSSDKFINHDILEFISNELNKCGLSINRSKTRFYSSKYKRSVTGIVITNDSHISVGTKRRTMIKNMIYNKLVNSEGDSNEILGYLSFLKDIEPDTYQRYLIKYSKFCTTDVLTALSDKNT